MKIVFVAECRITNKEQTIDKEEYKTFNSLIKAKRYITSGLKKWDGSGKGIANGQVSEEEREYDLTYPDQYDVIRRRVHSPMKSGWVVDDWHRV